MKTTEEKIEEIKRHGYNLEFGQTFEQTFENYKKIALIGGGVLLITGIILVVLIMGMAAAFGLFSSIGGGLTGFDFQGYSMVAIIFKIVIAVATAVITPVTAGLLKIAHHAETYKEYS